MSASPKEEGTSVRESPRRNMSGTMAGSTSNTSNEDLIGLLSPLNAEILKEFVHRCADEICGRKGPSEAKFCSPCSWTSGQFCQAVSGVKTFLVECVVHKYDREKVEKILSLPENQINGIMNCIAVRGDELQHTLLSHLITQSLSLEALCDYDWKVKWVMGSSSLSSLQETLLELDLTTVKGNMSMLSQNTLAQNGRIRLELTRENLNTLISALEKAQESV